MVRLPGKFPSSPCGAAASGPDPAGKAGGVRDHLTERQRCILRCISEWIAEYGEAPSIREIGQQVGLSSSSSVIPPVD
ncbi:hypothetical protein DMH18_26530 [Streptomyces sp. WAC 06783]|nr:hypothetical protein DMH18_26530 [Streptomyces sp. WAC 06783]